MMEFSLDEDAESGGELRTRLLPSNEAQGAAADDIASASNEAPELPLSLRLLYGLNGITLSLPMTALLYIVNTRASIPVPYLSAFGAIAFLPCSLKPLYACMSHHVQRQDVLLVLLLILSGICTAVTAFIPVAGVVWCFVLAFLRGVTSAWPELLLGLSLIQHARQTHSNFSFSQAAAHLQSQAATARNFGSLFATLVAFGIFIYRDLNDHLVTILLVTSGMLNVPAAIVAWWFQVGNNKIDQSVYNYEEDEASEDINYNTSTSDGHSSRRLFNELRNGNGSIVVIFQLCIVVFAVKGPIESTFSVTVWFCLMLVLVAALVMASVCSTSRQVKWNRFHRVGLFLIATNAVPGTSYIMGSFIYSQFQASPMLLQALSIVSMGTTTLSSWSYGRLFAGYSHGWSLLLVMAGTTVASSLLTLGNLAIVAEAHKSNHSWAFYLVIIFVGVVTSFAAEWKFLPDVVLATTTVGVQEEVRNESSHVDGLSSVLAAPVGGDIANVDLKQDGCRVSLDDRLTGIEYGTLISCIDFGDQIGSWVTVPLVAALGISRENDWGGLNGMIVLMSVLGLLSLLLLGILKDERQ